MHSTYIQCVYDVVIDTHTCRLMMIVIEVRTQQRKKMVSLYHMATSPRTREREVGLRKVEERVLVDQR